MSTILERVGTLDVEGHDVQKGTNVVWELVWGEPKAC